MYEVLTVTHSMYYKKIINYKYPDYDINKDIDSNSDYLNNSCVLTNECITEMCDNEQDNSDNEHDQYNERICFNCGNIYYYFSKDNNLPGDYDPKELEKYDNYFDDEHSMKKITVMHPYENTDSYKKYFINDTPYECQNKSNYINRNDITVLKCVFNNDEYINDQLKLFNNVKLLILKVDFFNKDKLVLPDSVEYLIVYGKAKNLVIESKNLHTLICKDGFKCDAKKLPVMLHTLVLDDTYNDKLGNLPHKLLYLYTGNDFDQDVSNLPHELKILICGNKFNKKVDFLPKGLEIFVSGNKFNHDVEKLIDVKVLMLGDSFNQVLPNLLQAKYLSLGKDFNQYFNYYENMNILVLSPEYLMRHRKNVHKNTAKKIVLKEHGKYLNNGYDKLGWMYYVKYGVRYGYF